jgi:hypothetical protein
MPWVNGPIVVYHGTDNLAANSIRSAGLLTNYFNPNTDFGVGFYVTTVLHQAEQWANQKCRRTSGALNAEVLEYQIPRHVVETLRHLTFVTATADYYDLVAFCRGGGSNRGPGSTPYDVVYGPVSLWPQTLALANCDQILLSNPPSLGLDFRYPVQSRVPLNLHKFF